MVLVLTVSPYTVSRERVYHPSVPSQVKDVSWYGVRSVLSRFCVGGGRLLLRSIPTCCTYVFWGPQQWMPIRHASNACGNRFTLLESMEKERLPGER
jgi:hypothetical protein